MKIIHKNKVYNYKSLSANKSTHYKRNEIRLKMIAKYSFGKILDMGCSVLPNPYLKGHVVGYDKNPFKYKADNYNRLFIGGAIADFKKIPGKFDTIIMGEFIEHLQNPFEWLSVIHGKLKKKGYLIITTPNPFSFDYIILNLFNFKRTAVNDDFYAIDRSTLAGLCHKLHLKIVLIKGTVMSIPKINLVFRQPWWFLSTQCVYIVKHKTNEEKKRVLLACSDEQKENLYKTD